MTVDLIPALRARAEVLASSGAGEDAALMRAAAERLAELEAGAAADQGWSRSDDWKAGRRNGVRWTVTWLHREASGMNDPSARRLLDGAAFRLGSEAARRLGTASA